MLQMLCSLLCGIYIFFWFECWIQKGIINTLKRYFVAMECADVVPFTFAT